MSLLESLFHQNGVGFDPFPAMNWKETPQAHVFDIVLPGVAKEDVKLQVDQDGGVVYISAQRKDDDDYDDEKLEIKWHCKERATGGGYYLRRQFRLPKDAKVDEIKASMRDGLLVVTVPKHQHQPNHHGNKINRKKKGIEISGDIETPPSNSKGLGRFVCCKA